MTKKLRRGTNCSRERKAMENTCHNLTEVILAAPTEEFENRHWR
jgi:hypothetical protein